jgi:hypothetical protein
VRPHGFTPQPLGPRRAVQVLKPEGVEPGEKVHLMAIETVRVLPGFQTPRDRTRGALEPEADDRDRHFSASLLASSERQWPVDRGTIPYGAGTPVCK